MEPQINIHVLVELTQGIHHPQTGTQSTFRVVLMGNRCAEEGHDVVTLELVNCPAEVLHHRHKTVETAIQQATNLLGVHHLPQRRRP